MAYEDFTSYSIVPDPLVYTTVAANKLDVNALPRSVDEYVYDDKGVDHFGATFTHYVKFTPASGGGLNGVGIFWAVSNDLDDFRAWLLGFNEALACYGYKYQDANQHAFHLANPETGGGDTSSGHPLDTSYHCTFVRTSETSCENRIYSNEAKTVLVDTLVVAVTSGRRYRYIFGTNSYNDASGDLATYDVENLDLNEVTYVSNPPFKTCLMLRGKHLSPTQPMRGY